MNEVKRELSYTEIEAIIARIIKRDDVYVMIYFADKLFPTMAQMFVNHGFQRD